MDVRRFGPGGRKVGGGGPMSSSLGIEGDETRLVVIVGTEVDSEDGGGGPMSSIAGDEWDFEPFVVNGEPGGDDGGGGPTSSIEGVE